MNVNVQGGLPFNLPRGGEEVLINGGGHARGRVPSSSKAVSNQSRPSSIGKHNLYTSNSIDVAMMDSGDERTKTSTHGKTTATATTNSDESVSFIMGIPTNLFSESVLIRQLPYDESHQPCKRLAPLRYNALMECVCVCVCVF